jgi:hypothetical protein
MKLTIRLTILAITAVAFAGVAGAQQRNGEHGSARSQAPRGQSGSRAGQGVRTQHYAPSRAEIGGGRNAYQPRGNPRGQGGYQPRGNPGGQVGYQPRGNPGGQVGYQPRGNFGGQNGYQSRGNPRGQSGYQARNDVRGRVGYRVPVAEHGRPLITRANATGRDYGRSLAYGQTRFGGERGFRGGREFRDGSWFYGGRAFPFGWEGRVVSGGFFPMAYAGYCDAVPVEYDYMLPPMAPSYDPCLFGDRVIVFDRFSRSIVFVATL